MKLPAAFQLVRYEVGRRFLDQFAKESKGQSLGGRAHAGSPVFSALV